MRSIVSDGLSQRAAPAAGPAGKIQHVVVIVQENRSLDNLFNGFPGAATVRQGIVSNGNTVALVPVHMVTTYDMDHSHQAFETDWNSGKLNGFDRELVKANPEASPAPTDAPYAYVVRKDVQPYWDLASQYVLADEMFQTNQGDSFPAHQYIISGTSATDSTGELLAMNNPLGSAGDPGGCDSAPLTSDRLIDPVTNDQSQTMFPCFDHMTLMDLMDNAGVSWRYYQPTLGPGLWYGPDAIRHIRYGSDYQNVVTHSILKDVASGTLPGVSWVIPTPPESDHAGSTDGSGPSYVANIVNTIGQSAYWNDTAIFVVWDDWGGWYEHVSPEQFNYYEDGFRVPLLAISPYSKRGYVSHVSHEFGSILKFIEETYNLPSLNYTDARSDDLGDMFNFNGRRRSYQLVRLNVSPSVLAKDAKASGVPDDDF